MDVCAIQLKVRLVAEGWSSVMLGVLHAMYYIRGIPEALKVRSYASLYDSGLLTNDGMKGG